MENINQLPEHKTAQDAMRFNDEENHIQGLYFDLLSCLGGGDHPILPEGYKQKEMTGFLEIVEAFNDVTKLHAAGSGIVLEVGSKEEVVEKGILISGNGETRKSSESSINSESSKTFLSDYDSQRLSSATSTQSSETTTSGNDLGGVQLNSNSHAYVSPKNGVNQTECFQKKETQNYIDKQKSLDENENSRVDTFDDARDILENRESYSEDGHTFSSYIASKHEEEEEANPTIFYANPNYVEEVGPTLKLSDPSLSTSVHRTSSMIERQLLKYSEELREIERILKEHHVTPPFLGTASPALDSSENSTENLHRSRSSSLPVGMLQTLSDGFMSPACALEMMYDMESSLYDPQSPRESTYESCTSFPIWQSQELSNVSSQRNFVDLLVQAPSDDVEYLNISENGNDITLESITLPVVSEQSTKNEYTVRKFRSSENRDNYHDTLLSEMVHFTTASIANTDVQDFVNVEQDTIKDIGKVEIGFSKSPVTSEDEHLWTSASGSESEDYEDVRTGSGC